MSAPGTFDERRWAAILVIAAFVVRASWIVELASLPWGEQLPSDCFVYDQGARRIAGGDWLMGSAPLRMSPGYFWVLGGVHAVVGSGPWAIRWLQAIGGAACVLLTWRIGRRLVPGPWALGAAGLVAFSGPLVFFDGAVLPESLASLGLTALLWAVVRARDAPSHLSARWALVGTLAGALAVLRPNALLVVPVVSGVALASTRAGDTLRTRTARAAIVLALAGLVILPITARNALATGRFVLLTSHAGVNLYVGNGPGATGVFRVPPDVPGADAPTTQFEAFRREASRAVGRDLDETEADRYWQRRTLDTVIGDPLGWLVLLARKLHLVFNGREIGLVLSYAFARECTSTLSAPLVQTGWLAPLALVGLLLALMPRTRDAASNGARASARSVALITATFAVSVALVFVSDRYRAPLVPAFALFAVLAVREIAEHVRVRDWRWLGLVGGALALAIVLAIPVRASVHFEHEWTKLGEGFLEDEENERALQAFDRALALDPDWQPAQVGRARALEALGRGSAR